MSALAELLILSFALLWLVFAAYLAYPVKEIISGFLIL
jgi:hypothetical protein